MCIQANFKDVKVAEEDMILYKVVLKSQKPHKLVHLPMKKVIPCEKVEPNQPVTFKYHSQFHPSQRSPQQSYGARGEFKEYKLGVKASSQFKDSFGLYCYVNIQDAELFVRSLRHIRLQGVLEVKVPKGTRFVAGYSDGSIAVKCVESLIPMKEIHV